MERAFRGRHNAVMEPPNCIVITDDNETHYFLLRRALKETCPDLCVEYYPGGEELLAHLGASRHPDLILLDLNMPGKDGFETLEAIRGNPKFAHIPVIILTTSSKQEDVVRSYQIGSNSFIRKPFTYHELKSAMAALKQYWFDTATLPPKEAVS